MKGIKTKRTRDSLILAFAIVTGLATAFTILGFSLKDLTPFKNFYWAWAVFFRTLIVLGCYALLSFVIWIIKGEKYKKSIDLTVGKNTVTIEVGDIFSHEAWRVIPMDTRFETVVDDVVIKKTSLHGQLVLDYGSVDGIQIAVEKEAKRRGLTPDTNGKYRFPLGTAIPYSGKGKKDKENKEESHYIMVAFTELNDDLESHTTLVQYEHTLMVIWKEISRVYAQHDIALPLMGSGITRFDDGQDNPSELLRCMICTLNTSKVHLKSKVSIIIYDKDKDRQKKALPLYEFKDFFRIMG